MAAVGAVGSISSSLLHADCGSTADDCSADAGGDALPIVSMTVGVMNVDRSARACVLLRVATGALGERGGLLSET